MSACHRRETEKRKRGTEYNHARPLLRLLASIYGTNVLRHFNPWEVFPVTVAATPRILVFLGDRALDQFLFLHSPSLIARILDWSDSIPGRGFPDQGHGLSGPLPWTVCLHIYILLLFLLRSFKVASSSSSDPQHNPNSHHRRRSSGLVQPLNLDSAKSGGRDGSSSSKNTDNDSNINNNLAARRGLADSSSARPSSSFALPSLASIPGTPGTPGTPAALGESPMSLSRSPSPRPGGGWSSPGLTTAGTASSSRDSPSPRRGYGDADGVNNNGGGDGGSGGGAGGGGGGAQGGISWAAAKAKSDQVRGYPSFSTRNNGFFSRQRRKISASLPRFRVNAVLDSDKTHTSTSVRAGWWSKYGPLLNRIWTLLGNLLRRTRIRLALVSIVLFVLWLIFANRGSFFYLSYSFSSS